MRSLHGSDLSALNLSRFPLPKARKIPGLRGELASIVLSGQDTRIELTVPFRDGFSGPSQYSKEDLTKATPFV